MRLLTTALSIQMVILLGTTVSAQNTGLQSINTHDLEMHMEFLASDELKGRDTGESGLQVAARYLAVQAKQIGLQPADPDGDYFQNFTIEEKSYDRERSNISVFRNDSLVSVNSNPFYMLSSVEGKPLLIEGEVIFAGYGINDEEQGYNDFEDIDISGKVVLIMHRAPMNEEGTEALFDEAKWTGMQGIRYKMPYIMSQGPKAVLMVMDPKSGYNSIDDLNPAIGEYLSSSKGLKSPEKATGSQSTRFETVMIHSSVADQLLARSGKSLKDLQLEIDRNLVPRSYQLKEISVRIDLQMKQKDIEVSNVFGIIEGGDPVLKDEVVIYVAHYDHVGTDGEGGVFNGADDNASGSVALIEIAEAFMKEKKQPARSIGILWVSAEEIGLFGSEYFAKHPLVPTENTAAVINLDMVGRTKTKEDVESGMRNLTIVGGDTVKVIGGLQSKILMEINQKTLTEMGLVGNYHYNDINHPDRYFYRSDHINFAEKDIPVLFYSTGTHADYHMVTDVEERIDYDKFLKMTRFGYKVGYNVARYRDAIEVDHPMSEW